MNITIDVVNDTAALRSACDVREEVFGKQCYRRLPRLEGYDPTQILTLIARFGFTDGPIAALSVVETTGDAAQHRALDLSFPVGIRVARYTQLAVLRPYRGLDLPARMISEARRLFVLPNQIRYSWLLFNAETARSSLLCRELCFKYSQKEFATEYGRSRVLVRKEQSDAADLVGLRFLESTPPSRLKGGHERHYILPQLIVENEWLAQ